MSDVDGLADEFRANRDQEKVESFDVSTTSLLLQQLGLSAQRVKQLRYDNGEAYCLSWATEELNLHADIWAARFFEYDLGQLLLAPQKSPVIQAYQERCAEIDTDAPRYMIFKAYDVGRLVATSALPQNRPYLCAVPGDSPVYITAFKNLFSETFGSDNEL